MFSRRIATATLMAMLLSIAIAGPGAAAKPSRPPVDAGERPLTPQEELESDEKVAAAQAYVAEVEAGGGDLATLGCATPLAATDTTDTTDSTTQSCSVPSGFIGAEARDQTKGHYCGPAVGQVIANWSWAMKSGVNKYTQAKIAGWMKTDIYGLTNAPELEAGLEAATGGSPRRPANWNWVVTNLRDYNGNGTVGDDLQNFVRSNVSGSKMPLAIPVKPHDKSSQYHLVSWPKPVSSPGHWIAAYGWYSHYTGTDFARIYYTDSSKDEGGSTGKFWDPTRHIAIMIMQHTGRLVW